MVLLGVLECLRLVSYLAEALDKPPGPAVGAVLARPRMNELATKGFAALAVPRKRLASHLFVSLGGSPKPGC